MIQISGKNQKLLIQPFFIVLPDKNEFECLHRDLKRFPPLERPAHAQQVLLLLFIYLFIYLFVCLHALCAPKNFQTTEAFQI